MASSCKATPRYSIGEWYGAGFEILSESKRTELAKRELEVDGLTGTVCPFKQNGSCNKKGGVCTLRKYGQLAAERVVGTGPLITVCPNRFLEQNVIFSWIGREILKTDKPIVLNEIGFLSPLDPMRGKKDNYTDGTGSYIGKI